MTSAREIWDSMSVSWKNPLVRAAFRNASTVCWREVESGISGMKKSLIPAYWFGGLLAKGSMVDGYGANVRVAITVGSFPVYFKETYANNVTVRVKSIDYDDVEGKRIAQVSFHLRITGSNINVTQKQILNIYCILPQNNLDW